MEYIPHCTYNKSMVICIYCQRQFIVLNNDQKCYKFLSIQPSSGINVTDQKKKKRKILFFFLYFLNFKIITKKKKKKKK